MKQHHHAEILRAIADGEPLENFEVHYSNWYETDWKSLADEWASWIFHPEKWQIRRKQKTIMVNGFEVPEPVREPLRNRQACWAISLADEGYAYELYWDNAPFHHNALKRGTLHLTKEAAVAHAKAMLGIDPREQS